MTSFFTSHFIVLVLVANIFIFQTSLCDFQDDKALISGICKQVQDPTFCLDTFRKILLTHPYIPAEVTRATIERSLENANDNRAFVQTAKAEAKDKGLQELYDFCDLAYGLLVNSLQDSVQSLAKKDYSGLEDSLTKCLRYVSGCQNALGDKVTEELLDRSRKQFDLVTMAEVAESLIQK